MCHTEIGPESGDSRTEANNGATRFLAVNEVKYWIVDERSGRRTLGVHAFVVVDETGKTWRSFDCTNASAQGIKDARDCAIAYANGLVDEMDREARRAREAKRAFANGGSVN